MPTHTPEERERRRREQQARGQRTPIPGVSPVRGNRGSDERPGPRDDRRDPIRGVTPVSPDSPSFGERASALGHGVNYGATQSMPVTGAFAGGKLGAPLGPWGSAAGAVLGAGAGYFAGQFLQDSLDIPSPEELPAEVRPYAYAGEAGGASIGPGMSMFAMRGSRSGNRFIDRIVQSMERSPGRVAAAETASMGASATAEGMSEALRPGDTGTRLAAGMVGGALTPSPLATLGIDRATNGTRRVMATLSRGGRERAAAAQLQNLLEQSGEDPQRMARLLREGDFQGLRRTAAQLTGSRALQEMESELTQRSGRFAREVQDRADDSLSSLRAMIAGLEETGDPAALQQATQLRHRMFNTIMEGHIDRAEREVMDAAERIQPVGPEGMDDLGRQARSIMEEALSKARRAESEIWENAMRGVGDNRAEVNSLLSEATRIRSQELLPEESLPDLANRFIRRVSDEEPTVRELYTFRSRMLEQARRATSEERFTYARVYGKLAEATLEDLEQAGGRELRLARDFSTVLNDRFTRSFAGDAVGRRRSGASRIPPEILMRRAVGTGQELTAMRLDQLKQAARFGDPGSMDEMNRIMDNTLRFTASRVVDPETGQVSAKRLARFRRNNSKLLEQFPELRDQLSSAQRAQEVFDNATRTGKQASRYIQQKSAVARVAQSENPTTEIRRILNSDQPERQFKELVNAAANDSDAAVEGLRSAVLNEARMKAGGADNFSFTAYRRALMEPRRPGGRSVLSMMRRNGVIDEETQGRLQRILKEADKIEQSMRAGSNMEGMLENNAPLADLIARVAGSRAMAASGAMEGTGGASIIMAGAGSKYAQHVFNKVPMHRLQDVLIEAAENPRFMASLLERPDSLNEKLQATRRINLYLWSAGIREPGEVAQGVSETVQENVQTEDELEGSLTRNMRPM